MSLVLDQLCVSYGAVQAIHGISLTVDKGRIITIIGSNGAGKTTIMKTIAGLVRPASGRILFGGIDLGLVRPCEIVTHGIALVPEGRRLFPSMTVRENLMIGAFRRKARGEIKRDFARVLEYLPVLRDRLESPARTLSGGQQQMLALGRSLMASPSLLMLDEPSIGLSPQMVQRISEIVKTINADGAGILIVEQNANLALGIADYGYVLEIGTIVLQGPAAELRGNEGIRAAYLGL
jgi:branched-chain amino acid transport system ATP-binding protein